MTEPNTQSGPPEEVEGQMALFDRDLNPTPEAQGFDPEDAEKDENPQEPPC